MKCKCGSENIRHLGLTYVNRYNTKGIREGICEDCGMTVVDEI